MRYVFLIPFLFLFLPTASFADTYPYSGKTPLMPGQSKTSGDDHEWLRLCGGKASKNAREIEKQVKKLSTPDAKVYQKAKAIERAKNYSRSTGCKENVDWVINRNNRYIKTLKRKVDEKLGKTTTTAKKKRYCKRLNGTVYDTLSVSNKPCANVKEITKVEYDRIIKLGNKPSKGTQVAQNDWRYCQNKYNEKLISRRYNKCDGSEIAISKIRYDNIKSRKTTSTASNKFIYCQNKKTGDAFMYNEPQKICNVTQKKISKNEYLILKGYKTTSTQDDGYLYCQYKDTPSVVIRFKAKLGSCYSNQKKISKTEYDNIKSRKTTSFEDQTEDDKLVYCIHAFEKTKNNHIKYLSSYYFFCS